ncbi:MAG: thiol peroxidase [Limnochordales bacterium]
MQITMRGNPVTLIGKPVEVGQDAPDFKVVDTDQKIWTLADTSGVRLFASVPSLDTGVCDAEVRRFNEEATKIGDAKVYVVSMDLPFAQKRWCGAAGVDNVVTFSDHRYASFGENWGVLIDGLRLLARAVFVVDSNNKVTYVEYVPEVGNQPNFEAALAAVRAAK